MKSKVVKIIISITVVLAVSVFIFHDEMFRIYKVLTLFERPNIVENFRSIDTIFDYRTVHNSNPVFILQEDKKQLPETYMFVGKEKWKMETKTDDITIYTLCNMC